MTTFSFENKNIIITIEGMDKLWAMKSHITIPIEHIVSVKHDPDAAKGWYHGLKFPGANIPGILTAGTFYKDHEKVFWDVHDPEKTIILTLKDESYQKLIIEVADVNNAIHDIEAVLIT